jgi:hypothetical protein
VNSSVRINCIVQFLIALVSHYSNDKLIRIWAKILKVRIHDPSCFWQNKPTSQRPYMSGGNFCRVSLAEY